MEMRCFLLILAVWIHPSLGQGSGPDCFCLLEMYAAQNFSSPLIIINAGDGTDRLFVAQQTGLLWTMVRDESILGGWQKLDEPYLNISVYYGINGGNEQGFLATRFHPNYASNGLLYSYYNYREGIAGDTTTRLTEFRVDPDNPDRADPSYSRLLLEIDQPFINHNGGEIWFDDEGYLLLSIGDGGSAGDPFGNGQDVTTLLGSIIRIDVDNTEGDLEYAIPPDNPFLDVPDARPELYAIGLRNTWRVFPDRSGNGTRYFMGDVGQNAWEEIDILQAGGNFGWNAFEADECFNAEICEDVRPEAIFPIHSYAHNSGDGQSLTQGPMYRGCENPNFQGWLFFGDYDSGNLFAFEDQGLSPAWTDRRMLQTCGPDVCTGDLTEEYPVGIVTFGLDERGEMYMGTTGYRLPPAAPRGRVFKFVDPTNPGEPCPLP